MCFLFQNSYSQQNINGWYWLNGQPQSITLNWVKILNSSTFLAAGNNGVFMKSTDGGDSWVINSQAGAMQAASLNYGGTQNILTAWFFDANTGLVGGSSASAFGDAIGRTTDGGLTFNRISLGLTGYQVLGFYFINSNTGYACGNTATKVMKTTDAGMSWNEVPNTPSNTYNSVFAFDENNIFAVTNSGRRLAKTTDAGTTWKIDTLPGTTNINLTDIGFKNSSTGYVTGNANYFAYTNNGGANWTQAISPGLLGQRALMITGNDVYTCGDIANIHKTTDDGTTWSSVNFIDGSNPNQPTAGIMYNLDINGSDMIVIGTSGLINISADGGSSWRNKNYCVSNTAFNFSAVWADLPNGNIWAAGTSNSILYSSNGGANWVQQVSNSNQPTNNIQMLNSTTGFAVSGNSTPTAVGILVKTTNAGTNWVPISLPSPYSERNAVDIDFLNENTGWVIGGKPLATGGGITCIKTTNGGVNWAFQNNDLGYAQVSVDIDMVDANTGYFIAGTALHVFKTTNGGNNWIKLPSSPGSQAYNKIQALSASNVVLSGGGGQLFRSTDGGTTWNPIPVTNPLITFFAMDWADAMNGMIGGTGGYIAKTTNGGLNWTTFNTGGSTIRNVCIRNKDTVFAVSDINGSWQIFRYTEPAALLLSMNLTVGIEGFWNGTTQVSDTVKATLRSQNSPYSIIDQSSAVLDNSGYATFVFSSAPAGNYYIQITHRNSLETWSGAPVYLSSNSNDYDFTTAITQAYGSNMILTSGRYCDYSGDVTQNGSVDLTDLTQIYNSSVLFTTGYVADDVNGDNIVDLSDIVITFNNASNFVIKVTP